MMPTWRLVRVLSVVTSLAFIPPVAAAENHVVLVNGSFNAYPPWMDPGQPEYEAIAASFGLQPEPHRWEDNDAVFPHNGYSGIINGGLALADFIDSLELSPEDNVDIVAHSHGGNVVKLAAYWVTFRHVINLATPVNFDLWTVGPYVTGNFCQASSYSDYVQFIGSSPLQVGFFVYHEFEAAQNSYYAVEALINENMADFEYYSGLAAYHFLWAEAWWYSTKDEWYATNFTFYGGQSHGDMHEPPVWYELQGYCW